MDDVIDKLAVCCYIHRTQGFEWTVVLLHTNYRAVDPADVSLEDKQLATAVYTHWVEDTLHLLLTGETDMYMNTGRTMLLGQKPFSWVFGMSLVESYKKILRREQKTVDGTVIHANMTHH
jgi:hypothetical protein